MFYVRLLYAANQVTVIDIVQFDSFHEASAKSKSRRFWMWGLDIIFWKSFFAGAESHSEGSVEGM